jgi:hypothetical protein
MQRLLDKWPLMFKSNHRAVKLENMTLRDALREANNELRKHRTTLAMLGQGDSAVTVQVERVLATKR